MPERCASWPPRGHLSWDSPCTPAHRETPNTVSRRGQGHPSARACALSSLHTREVPGSIPGAPTSQGRFRCGLLPEASVLSFATSRRPWSPRYVDRGPAAAADSMIASAIRTPRAASANVSSARAVSDAPAEIRDLRIDRARVGGRSHSVDALGVTRIPPSLAGRAPRRPAPIDLEPVGQLRAVRQDPAHPQRPDAAVRLPRPGPTRGAASRRAARPLVSTTRTARASESHSARSMSWIVVISAG